MGCRLSLPGTAGREYGMQAQPAGGEKILKVKFTFSIFSFCLSDYFFFIGLLLLSDYFFAESSTVIMTPSTLFPEIV